MDISEQIAQVLAKAEADRERECILAVEAAHRGSADWPTWEGYMAEILVGGGGPDADKLIAACALIAHGKEWALRVQAYEAMGFKVCSECEEIKGLDCHLPDSCPDCHGHGWVKPQGGRQQGCAGCDEYGTRQKYDERQKAASHAA